MRIWGAWFFRHDFLSEIAYLILAWFCQTGCSWFFIVKWKSGLEVRSLGLNATFLTRRHPQELSVVIST